ncbi:hypothetical protein N431DRAFT_468286 [Stipitochalara longipes BDJ]|nr:hypothetical protein N431DRAFT_468286 [Stipitochalara longipes BDJ]
MSDVPRTDELDTAKSKRVKESNVQGDGEGGAQNSRNRPTQSDKMTEEGEQTSLTELSHKKDSTDQPTRQSNKMAEGEQTSLTGHSESVEQRPTQSDTLADGNDHATNIEPISSSHDNSRQLSASNLHGEKEDTDSFLRATNRPRSESVNMAQEEDQDVSPKTPQSSSPPPALPSIEDPAEMSTNQTAISKSTPPSKSLDAISENV